MFCTGLSNLCGFPTSPIAGFVVLLPSGGDGLIREALPQLELLDGRWVATLRVVSCVEMACAPWKFNIATEN